MTSENLFDALGFRWDRAAVPIDVPVHSLERVCFRFHKMLAQFVWDASALEGSPITFPEVMTKLDGIEVGRRSKSDQELILDIAEGFRQLRQLVQARSFLLDAATFKALGGSALRAEWSADHIELFEAGVARLLDREPFEKALVFLAFSALKSELTDGKIWISLLMMNGVLMSNGLDAISVPANRAEDFNDQMSRFRETKDATGVMKLLIDCRYPLEDRAAVDETVEIECVVSALVPQLQQVRVRDSGGHIYAITQATVGVDMAQLVENQRLRCTVTVHLPRILSARLIESGD